MRDEYDIFWKYHNKENMDVHAVKLIENQAERIKELEAKNKAILCRAEAAEEDWQSAEKRIKELEERIEVLEQLLVCYRVGRNPSEALHRKLEKTKQALEKDGE